MIESSINCILVLYDLSIPNFQHFYLICLLKFLQLQLHTPKYRKFRYFINILHLRLDIFRHNITDTLMNHCYILLISKGCPYSCNTIIFIDLLMTEVGVLLVTVTMLWDHQLCSSNQLWRHVVRSYSPLIGSYR